MRSYEETWTSRGAVVSRDDGKWVGRFSPSPGESPDFEAARAKLAAQAPAMVRLLLAIGSTDMNASNGERMCGACWITNEHAADCPLVAVLRAAGVTS